MKFLLSILLLGTVLSKLQSKNETLALYDVQRLEGSWRYANGVDLLDLTERSYIFNLSYDLKQTTPDGKFFIPDNVMYISSPKCSLKAETQVFESYHEYKSKDSLRYIYGIQFPLKLKFQLFEIEVTASYTDDDVNIREHLINRKQIFTNTEAKCQVYDIEHEELDLSDQFKKAIKDLPSSYDYKKYGALIQRFGTHFRGKITLGGHWRQRIFTKSSFRRNTNKKKTISDLALTIFQRKSVGQTQNIKEFSAASTVEDVVAEGGNTDILHWDAWLRSIPENPIVLFQELFPISDLIDDEDKKNNLIKALHKYLIRPGCTHPLAVNRNISATKDDGTCEDPVLIN